MGGISPYLQKYIQEKRSEHGYSYGITIWTMGTGAGWNADDAYRQVTYVPTLDIFTGCVGFGAWRQKTDTSAGYFNTSDIVIVAHDSWKSKVNAEKVKVQLESGSGMLGIFYRPDRIIDCPDTDEIVIYASRIEE